MQYAALNEHGVIRSKQDESAANVSGEHDELEVSVANYRLPPHVHVCATCDGVVFLDLRRDKYFGLGRRQARALAAVIRHWPIHPTNSATEDELGTREIVEIADNLVVKGLLVRSQLLEMRETFLSASPNASMIAVGQDNECQSSTKISDVMKFLWAYIRAIWLLRFCSVESAVRRVRTRKERRRNLAKFDLKRAEELVAKFRRFRTFLFSAKDRCLFHSVVLVGFLSLYDIYPTWVIGVKARPFDAHSWVEHENFVLDGTPEEVAFYTPILAV